MDRNLEVDLRNQIKKVTRNGELEIASLQGKLKRQEAEHNNRLIEVREAIEAAGRLFAENTRDSNAKIAALEAKVAEYEECSIFLWFILFPPFRWIRRAIINRIVIWYQLIKIYFHSQNQKPIQEPADGTRTENPVEPDEEKIGSGEGGNSRQPEE